MKRIAFDIDGTLCPEGPAHDRMYQLPFLKIRERVNRAYDAGHHVVILSARHWNDYRATQDWLNSWGFKFHQLELAKYPYDFLYDDRASHTLADLDNFLDNS